MERLGVVEPTASRWLVVFTGSSKVMSKRQAKKKQTTRDETTKRVTLDLSKRFFERLEALQDMTEAESKASLIRDALQVYEFIVKRTLDGCSFKAVSKAGD